MAHLTDADLQDLIAGRLDASGRCSTAEHLARCDACLLRCGRTSGNSVLERRRIFPYGSRCRIKSLRPDLRPFLVL